MGGQDVTVEVTVMGTVVRRVVVVCCCACPLDPDDDVGDGDGDTVVMLGIEVDGVEAMDIVGRVDVEEGGRTQPAEPTQTQAEEATALVVTKVVAGQPVTEVPQEVVTMVEVTKTVEGTRVLLPGGMPV